MPGVVPTLVGQRDTRPLVVGAAPSSSTRARAERAARGASTCSAAPEQEASIRLRSDGGRSYAVGALVFCSTRISRRRRRAAPCAALPSGARQGATRATRAYRVLPADVPDRRAALVRLRRGVSSPRRRSAVVALRASMLAEASRRRRRAMVGGYSRDARALRLSAEVDRALYAADLPRGRPAATWRVSLQAARDVTCGGRRRDRSLGIGSNPSRVPRDPPSGFGAERSQGARGRDGSTLMNSERVRGLASLSPSPAS